MTTALTIRNDMDVMTLGKVLSRSGYFADARDEAQAVVKILAGAELGFGPIASMSGVYIVNGKPTLSANLMAAAIKRSRKYDYRITRLDNDGCDIAFYQGADQIGISTFTRQDAQNAGALTGKNQHTWKAYARNMLFARALSNGARWYTPDIFGGPIYTPEEMDAHVDEDGNVLVDALPPTLPAPQQVNTSTGEIEDNCEADRTLLKQLRDELKALGGTPRPLTRTQVLSMSCELLRAELDETGVALDAIKAQQSSEQPASVRDEWDAIEASEKA